MHPQLITRGASALIALFCLNLCACNAPRFDPRLLEEDADMDLVDDADTDMDASQDIRPDEPPTDHPPDLDVPRDELPDACEGVSCGTQGRCVIQQQAPACMCNTGYRAEGLSCVAIVGPSFTNLPAQEDGEILQDDQYQLAASVAQGAGAPVYSVVSTTCSFPVSVSGAGMVLWSCGIDSETCDTTLRVAVADQRDEGVLTIQCTRGLPRILSTPPASSREGEESRYTVDCEDPDGGEVTLRVGPNDTCGARMQGVDYVWTPTELQGGGTCQLDLLCSNGEDTERQQAAINVEETNQAPLFLNLPAAASALHQRAGQFTAQGDDPDVPAQSLTFSRSNTTCSFNPTVNAAGIVRWTCPAAVETCEVEVELSDGEEAVREALTISCENSAPSVSNVTISPNTNIYPGTTITCNYNYADPDSDPDNSTITWTVNNVDTGTGTTFTPSLADKEVRCKVEPSDGLSNGPSIISNPLVIQSPYSGLEAGGDHTCVFYKNTPYCWGNNDHGQLTDGNPLQLAKFTPFPLNGLQSATNLSIGGHHICSKMQNNELKCWGKNTHGQLGIGTTQNTHIPTTIQNISTINSVSLGDNHTCATLSTSQVMCWGLNTNGQLGDGTTTARKTPIQVSGPSGLYLTDALTVRAGGSHSCAIRSTGAVCWGRGLEGQLGNNNFNNSSRPVSTTISSPPQILELGDNHTCTENGCWGSNDAYQLQTTAPGNFSTLTSFNPQLNAISIIATGERHTCTYSFDRRPGPHQRIVICSGSNDYGQIATGAFSTRENQNTITLPEPIKDLAAGYNHTCAMTANGVYCWGYNNNGQLGDGTTTNRTTPTLVTFP